ncbi:MAG: pyridoxamine 5'-phosphate oxidase [Stellaceae bacterium]
MDEITETEPLSVFARWFGEAHDREELAEAMTLATAARDGRPSLRAVLLKGFDARGFVFYTNLESRKSGELADNPQAALCFLWKTLRRQVRIEGEVTAVSEAEADAYFASRPRDSRIGAWASDQSRPLSSRAALEQRIEKFGRRFADAEVPRPPFWSGFRVAPQRIEFWQERPSRLHDRWLFIREAQGWRCQRLFP